MVRTDTKEKAKGLEELYKAKTSLHLKRIDSSMSFGTVQRTIKSLRGKELDGIICVEARTKMKPPVLQYRGLLLFFRADKKLLG